MGATFDFAIMLICEVLMGAAPWKAHKTLA